MWGEILDSCTSERYHVTERGPLAPWSSHAKKSSGSFASAASTQPCSDGV